jgi:uncharacterized protein YdeI (YjbR/CyaY-like superfamily)
MPEQPIIAFVSVAKFRQWLTRHHANHPGIWLKIAKKPETRRKRIADFGAMLKRGEKLH